VGLSDAMNETNMEQNRTSDEASPIQLSRTRGAVPAQNFPGAEYHLAVEAGEIHSVLSVADRLADRVS
jgi:hypothetical protein